MATERTRIFRGSAIGLALGVAALAAACSGRGADFRFVELSGRMPALSGETLTGGTLGPDHYRGRAVLINFWATWCGPCRREQPGLEALWRRLRPGGKVAFIGVDYRDRDSKARAWIERYGVTYPSIRDPNGRVGERFDVPFLPTTILADARGELRFRLVGEQDPDVLEDLLEEIAGPL